MPIEDGETNKGYKKSLAITVSSTLFVFHGLLHLMFPLFLLLRVFSPPEGDGLTHAWVLSIMFSRMFTFEGVVSILFSISHIVIGVLLWNHEKIGGYFGILLGFTTALLTILFMFNPQDIILFGISLFSVSLIILGWEHLE